MRITRAQLDTRDHHKGTETQSDLELVAAINRGDTIAFEVLYHRYRDWVVALAFRFTRDEDLSLDVLQETFLYVLKKFPGFQLTSTFKTFLYPAVKNLAIAARKKARRYQSTEEEMVLVENTPDPSAGGNFDDMRAILKGLSEDHREVLLLRFVDGLDLLEIAQAMDIPLGTVKSRLHNALNILRADPGTKSYFE